MKDSPIRTWCEVDLSAITNNLQQIRKKIGNQRNLIAVIKADAYGHGAVEIAKLAQKVKVKYFGLATYDEAITLRLAGIKTPILVLSCCQSNEIDAVLKYQLTPNLCDYAIAKKT